MWLQCGLFCDGAVTWRHCPAHISTLAAADQQCGEHEYRIQRRACHGGWSLCANREKLSSYLAHGVSGFLAYFWLLAHLESDNLPPIFYLFLAQDIAGAAG